MKRKRLLIISDTRMQFTEGRFFAFNSVVKELDVFTELFDSITWIGFDYSDCPFDNSLMEISHQNVKVIALKRTGGKSLLSKIRILFLIPNYFVAIIKNIFHVDTIHSRGPSVPMLLALMISFVYRKPLWWFKYANNWSDPKPPVFWRLQRIFMKQNKSSRGTINGSWLGNSPHLLSFENPCLSDTSPSSDMQYSKIKTSGWRLLFVGRIEKKKGYKIVVNILNNLTQEKIESISIIGDGSERQELEQLIDSHEFKNKIKYLGAMSTLQVFDVMKQSHFLLLPTTSSEGFPKVIAEAWYNGCVPIVSDVSSIGQYVKDNINGFLWNPNNNISFQKICVDALFISEKKYMDLIKSGIKMSELFTYSRYKKRIEDEILTTKYH